VNTYALALSFGALAIPALAGMWLAWRARARRDAELSIDAPKPSGELIADFSNAGYVATSRSDAPLERVAIPGLRYKGSARVTVRRDGIVIAVTGEEPVSIPAARVIDTSTARVRIGKAVERDGLSLLRWTAGSPANETAEARDVVESSFRFSDSSEQHRFALAVAELTGPASSTQTHPTNLEDV